MLKLKQYVNSLIAMAIARKLQFSFNIIVAVVLIYITESGAWAFKVILL